MSDLNVYVAALDQLVYRARRIAARLNVEEAGQDIIEYAGILAVVAVIIAALITEGPKVGSAITTAVDKIISGK